MNDFRWLTLERLAQRLTLTIDTLSDHDRNLLNHALRAAELALSLYTGRRHAPLLTDWTHTPRRPLNALPLLEDALELMQITLEDGEVLSPADLILSGGLVRRTDGQPFLAGAHTVRALWAYHPAPDLAFQSSGELVLVPGLSDSAALMDVTEADGYDPLGTTPRFGSGHLIRIDDELLRVETVVTPSLIGVQRAQNGTTAAAHSAGTPILRYAPAAEWLGIRWAAWLLRESDTTESAAPPAALLDAARALRRVSAA